MDFRIFDGRSTEAVISSLGGTVLSFKVGGKDILYPYAMNEDGKARGGCPICAPWFGKTEFGEKKHGFLRNLEANEVRREGEDSIVFSFSHEGISEYPWGIEYHLIVSVVSGMLKMFLTTKRIDDGLFNSAPVNLAFHPYFALNGGRISVTEGRTTYVDCFSEQSTSIETGNPSVLIENGKSQIVMSFGGSTDERSRLVFWSDNKEKYACIEPVLTDKKFFNTSEGHRLHLNNSPLSLFMSLAVL